MYSWTFNENTKLFSFDKCSYDRNKELAKRRFNLFEVLLNGLTNSIEIMCKHEAAVNDIKHSFSCGLLIAIARLPSPREIFHLFMKRFNIKNSQKYK